MSLDMTRSAPSSWITAFLALSLCGLAAACGDGQESSTTGGSAGSGGSGGSSGTGAASSCSPGPEELPPKQKVDVEINNTTAIDKYVLTACNGCETIHVEQKGDLDYVALPTALLPAQTCGCECPKPAVYPAGYHHVAAGMSYTASWDARILTLCTYGQDCGGGSTASISLGALAPAEPGDYRVSFGIVDKLPAGCMQMGGSGDYTCSEPAMPDPDPGGGFVPIEFTLAEMGDLSLKLGLQ